MPTLLPPGDCCGSATGPAAAGIGIGIAVASGKDVGVVESDDDVVGMEEEEAQRRAV